MEHGEGKLALARVRTSAWKVKTRKDCEKRKTGARLPSMIMLDRISYIAGKKVEEFLKHMYVVRQNLNHKESNADVNQQGKGKLEGGDSKESS